MNITQEKIDDLNAVVKVKVEPADYTEKVEKALKTYQKRAEMPGFRQGKVPASLVRKMYGKAVLAEELNRILSDSLYQYIQENKIEVLGNPLPKEENNKVDFDTQSEFEFQFDMALAPQFQLELSPDMEFTEFVIGIDEKLVDNYVNDLTRRYGRIEPADSTVEGDLIYGDFVQLDSNGEILPGGIFKSSTLFLDKPVKEAHKAMIGAKSDDKFVLSAKDISEDPKDLATKLGISTEEAENIDSSFQITLKSISRLIPAELNQELFDKVYGPGAVTSTEQLREKIANEMRHMFARETGERLRTDITNRLLAITNLSLPDEFLKRWLLAANEKPLTRDQVESEYPIYARQLRWQLIENKLIRDNNLSVSQEEAQQHVKSMLRANFAKYGRNPDEVTDDELTNTAKSILSKENEGKRIYEEIFGQKLMTLYRSECTIRQKEVSYDEFLAS
ncbi:MAG TPA: trigger factor [Bacteroidia bacterium]|nr:trigger factor [Bacteroidia bacterium]